MDGNASQPMLATSAHSNCIFRTSPACRTLRLSQAGPHSSRALSVCLRMLMLLSPVLTSASFCDPVALISKLRNYTNCCGMFSLIPPQWLLASTFSALVLGPFVGHPPRTRGMARCLGLRNRFRVSEVGFQQVLHRRLITPKHDCRWSWHCILHVMGVRRMSGETSRALHTCICARLQSLWWRWW